MRLTRRTALLAAARDGGSPACAGASRGGSESPASSCPSTRDHERSGWSRAARPSRTLTWRSGVHKPKHMSVLLRNSPVARNR